MTTHDRERPMPVRPLRVLVVDDDASARVGMAKVAAYLGHTPTVADDGEEALTIQRRMPSDVVLTDWCMPHMHGDELVRRIRQVDGDERYTYIVMCTAYGDDEHRLAAMRSGADDFLMKPIDVVQLEARLLSAARVIDFDRGRIARAAALRRDSVRLAEIADTDALTGVLNRRRLDRDLAAVWGGAHLAQSLPSIAILDIDHFKRFNDTYGHLAGDEVLRGVAQALQGVMRGSDRLYRYGGEEFLVLFPEATGGVSAAERLRSAVSSSPDPNGERYRGSVTASVGAATLDPSRDRTVEDWVGRADAALYRAKKQGRDRVAVDT